MDSWDIRSLDVEPHHPRVLHSDDDARLIAINLPAGELLQEHQVHERAYLFVADGELEVEQGGSSTSRMSMTDRKTWKMLRIVSIEPEG